MDCRYSQYCNIFYCHNVQNTHNVTQLCHMVYLVYIVAITIFLKIYLN